MPPPGIVRVLALSNLAKSTGNGILMATLVLYFTRTVAIPTSQVGLALTIGAAVGMAASIPAGRAADRLGPRTTTIGFLTLLGLATCGYAIVDGFAGLVAVAMLVIASDSAANAARGALVAGLVAAGERTRALSYMRSMANIGVSLGAIAAAVALHFDTRAAYTVLLIAAGVLFAGAGTTFLTVPRVPPTIRAKGAPWTVLRDKPYAVIAVINAVLVMNGGILVVALPIWIAEHTTAPVALYPILLLINTVAVVLFQVAVGKSSENVTGGARALRRSGVLLAVCCAVFAAAATAPTPVAVAILLAGTLVHVLGEMLYSAGSWSLSFGLAPDDAQGQYQGLFGASTQLGAMVTPLAVTTLIAGLGATGWLSLAIVMLAAGIATPAVTRWAERSPRTPSPQVPITTRS